MTVGQLIRELKCLDEKQKVIFKPENNDYGYSISDIETGKGIASFYGKDYKAIVLHGNQCGAVVNVSDLDLEEEEL